MELATVFLVYWWLARWHVPHRSLVAALVLAVFFDFAFYGFLVRSEILFTWLILMSVLMLLKLLETWDWSMAMMVGLLLGLATLTRPISHVSGGANDINAVVALV